MRAGGKLLRRAVRESAAQEARQMRLARRGFQSPRKAWSWPGG
jgi:hypothetical protein